MHQSDLLLEQFCDVIFADWVSMAILSGKLGAVTLDAATIIGFASWMCAGWPWIDPVKDATAALMELNMGATSIQRICAEKGRDFYEIIDEIADAKAYCELKGVTLEAVALSIAVTADPNANPDAAGDGARVLPLRKGAA
jgi:capsid protein